MSGRRLWRTPPPSEAGAEFDEDAGSCQARSRRAGGIGISGHASSFNESHSENRLSVESKTLRNLRMTACPSRGSSRSSRLGPGPPPTAYDNRTDDSCSDRPGQNPDLCRVKQVRALEGQCGDEERHREADAA